MEPWFKPATPRKEVREGRSFNPDEFAIHLEQVVAGTAPDDYAKPAEFFRRTCFTRALREHAGLVLRRLAGETANTSPVLTLVTQFGGGKTHTLAALYHLARNGEAAREFAGVSGLLSEAGLSAVPAAKVAVFVGNAWDPSEGRETPWIDVARQLAGDEGVKALGPAALTTPPGTEALGRVFQTANAPVLILFDEVLNFLNRHRHFADSFHAFIQNLTVATTGTTRGATVISLPRSQVEMTDWDMQWQDKITKVVRRVSRDLIVNDEAEISEVVRRRLFEDLGNERVRKNVAKVYADWCFERRAELPPEWTAVDSAATEAKAREHLRTRFETCYPFHPAALSVFQRKWQALPQYQQTRGTLAMLAQWVSWAFRSGYSQARREPLITLGSAPLEVPEFRSVVLGQLGEARLIAALDADVSGSNAHSRALDADATGQLAEIHTRVGRAIFFESSGGQVEKVAHLPELRFALGEPRIDTTSIDNAAFALEDRAYFIRKVGSDGFAIGYKPKLVKVVNDRRASLDEDKDVFPSVRAIVRRDFELGASIPTLSFPSDSSEVADTPRLTLVIADPVCEWTGTGSVREQIREWTRQRGTSPRLYPGALVWCLKRPGRDLRDRIEKSLAWKQVAREVKEGTLGGDFERGERTEIEAKVRDAEEQASDEVWAGYRFVVVADAHEPDGLKVIDLGAGHASGSETLCGRVIRALKSEGLLDESVGAGYIDRNWPPALKETGAWPLASLRQSFLNGSLTRLLDADAVLRGKIVDFVGKGDFGLASGRRPDGTFERVWFEEPVAGDEVSFEAGVFLLQKRTAEALTAGAPPVVTPTLEPEPWPGPTAAPGFGPVPGPGGAPVTPPVTLLLGGSVPSEMWNRFNQTVVTKLRTSGELKMGIELSVTVPADSARYVEAELRQLLQELGLGNTIRISEDS